MKKISTTVRLFSLHGRNEFGPIDYGKFFQHLMQMDGASRVVSLPNDLSIAVESMQHEGVLYKLRLLVGNPEEVPLLFDQITGQVSAQRLRPNQWFASATHVVVDARPDRRIVALELRRNGISAATFEHVLEELGSESYGKIKIDLAPLAAQSFLEEIERFERIKEATLVIARPNFDWNDHNDRLHELADESGAARAESTVTAGREQSLDKRKGLVGYIKSLAREAIPDVKNAIVRGRRHGESQDSSVSLQRHVLSGRVEYDPALSMDERVSSIWSQSVALMDRLVSRAAETEDDDS